MPDLKRSLSKLFSYASVLINTPGVGSDEAVPVSASNPLPVLVIGGTVGGGGGGTTPTPATPPVTIDPLNAYNSGFTPTADGTLLIQSLCRECYFEGYLGEATPINTLPASQPVFSCGPEQWIQVPVKSGVKISFFMNGNSAPPHIAEVQIRFYPGVFTQGSGPMLRHPLDGFLSDHDLLTAIRDRTLDLFPLLAKGDAANTTSEAVRALLAGVLRVSATALPLPAGAATQATLAQLLTALQAQAVKTEAQPVSAAALPLPAGAATEATLAGVKAAIQAQIDIASTVWTDNSGAYFVRRDLVNEGTGAITTVFVNPDGSAATTGPGLRPLASTGRVVIEAAFDALAAGTGYVTGDLLERVAIHNPDTGATSFLWFNLSAGTTLGTAPTPATVQRADEAITARLSDSSGAAVTLGAKAGAASLPVVLASDQALPLPNGAATQTTLAAVLTALGPLGTDARLELIRVLLAAMASKTDTQPVSAAALPLPTGAATDATLAAQSAKLPASLGQKDSAQSLSVTQASDGSGVTLASAGFQKVTDGTNTAAVKPASTAPAGTDPALVVTLHPNSVLPGYGALGTTSPAAISTANSAQIALAANAARKYLFVQNNSAGDLWFNFSAAATIGGGIKLLPGTSYENPGHFRPVGAVSIIGATAGQAFTAVEA